MIINRVAWNTTEGGNICALDVALGGGLTGIILMHFLLPKPATVVALMVFCREPWQKLHAFHAV